MKMKNPLIVNIISGIVAALVVYYIIDQLQKRKTVGGTAPGTTPAIKQNEGPVVGPNANGYSYDANGNVVFPNANTGNTGAATGGTASGAGMGTANTGGTSGAGAGGPATGATGATGGTSTPPDNSIQWVDKGGTKLSGPISGQKLLIG